MSILSVRRRASLVLASFVAAVVMTVVAPLVRPIVWERLCSAQGSRVVAVVDGLVVDDGRTMSHDDHAAHCPLCMPAGAPPSHVAWDFTAVQPLAQVLRSIPAARLASLVGAPLPARGPPVPV